MKTMFTIITAITLAAAPAFAQGVPDHAVQGETGTGPAAVKQVYGHYLLIQSALAGDTIKGVAEAAATIAKLARSDSTLPAAIADQAESVGQAKDLTAARAAFKELSATLIQYRKNDEALTERYYVVHCPMAFNNQGADWLQATKQVANPYYGASMLRCGKVQN